MTLIRNLGQDNSTSRSNKVYSKIVRVFDIVLNDKHPLFSEIPYDPTLIGLIFYGEKDLNIGSIDPLILSRALPKDRSTLPLINELVEVERGPSSFIYSSLGGKNQFTFSYYGPVIPVHNNPVHNALPREVDVTPSSNPTVDFNSGGSTSTDKEVVLDNTNNFEEKPKITSLQPFAGDKIFEGRAGHTIRFGTSNQEGENPWSDGPEKGDPIIIQRIGNFEGLNGGTHIEDINRDYVSIYMCSNHKINNLILTNDNFDSLNSKYTPPQPAEIELASSPIEPIQQSLPPSQEINFEEEGPIEETTPMPVTSSLPSGGDPVFDALDESVDEGLLEEQIYSFELEEPERSAAAEAVDTNGVEVTPDDNSNEIAPNLDTFKETLPVEELPGKVPKYLPVYVGESRFWTQVSPSRLAQIINLNVNDTEEIRTSILFIALKEQSRGNSIGGFNYNHYGIMADLGKWGHGNLINGSVLSTEGSGGQGIRTTKYRAFASFKSEQTGTSFMARTIKDKAKLSKERTIEGTTVRFNAGPINRDNILDFYVLKWLAPSDNTVKKLLITNRNQNLANYQAIWDRALNLIKGN